MLRRLEGEGGACVKLETCDTGTGRECSQSAAACDVRLAVESRDLGVAGGQLEGDAWTQEAGAKGRLTDQLRGMTSRALRLRQPLAAGAAARCSRPPLASRHLGSCEGGEVGRLHAGHTLEREYCGGEGDAAVAPYWRRQLKGGRGGAGFSTKADDGGNDWQKTRYEATQAAVE